MEKDLSLQRPVYWVTGYKKYFYLESRTDTSSILIRITILLTHPKRFENCADLGLAYSALSLSLRYPLLSKSGDSWCERSLNVRLSNEPSK